ncbi:MAG: transcription termination/antitermination protein NusA [Spirochaetales bacterium]|nr:transcription termination/antitermination protein NusA [Spirochaetales bacterium]
MTLNLSTAIREINQEKGISEELIQETIESALTHAYKKYYGTLENLSIRVSDGFTFTVNSIKEVVEELDDDLFEIELSEAVKFVPSAKLGDKLEIPCDPKEFGQLAIHSAKQTILQRLKEIEKNTKLSNFKRKEGEIIVGFVQRVKDGNVFVNLGDQEPEGILLKMDQSPAELEIYSPGDRIKSIIYKVEPDRRSNNISIRLSRRNEEFVKKLLMLEIPELSDETIKIKEIQREAGYRTKVAVYTEKDEIDPVGACVGSKGNRIQNITKELSGEKIDVIQWSANPKVFIAHALTPAEVIDVIITNEEEKTATAIMEESQLSFAIGARGANINLAKKISGWKIDVITKAEALENNLIIDQLQKAEELFRQIPEDEEVTEENDEVVDNNIEETSAEGDYMLDDLEISDEIKTILTTNKIYSVEELIKIEDFSTLPGITPEMAKELQEYIDENFDIIDEDLQCPECGAALAENAEKCPNCGIDIYYCPDCGAPISVNETKCSRCGVEIEFEKE